ncbi:MAG: GspH/FimT family pseudopilin [Pseudomonadota bacterium]|nr:GspH/FimT family pseudopilin [Pseudomonadota bacterium]
MRENMVMRTTYSSGVTLIELLISISILAILLTVAVPSFQTSIVNNRLGTYSNALFSSLILARSEAIKRNKRVVVCKSSDGESCTGNWGQGWIVFVDTNNDATVSSGEVIVQKSGALENNYSLTGNEYIASYVSYSSEGVSKTVSGAMQAGTFELCPPSPAPSGNGRNIVISSTGKPRVEAIATCPTS